MNLNLQKGFEDGCFSQIVLEVVLKTVVAVLIVSHVVGDEKEEG